MNRDRRISIWFIGFSKMQIQHDIIRMNMDKNEVAISYAWIDEKYKEKVLALADLLRSWGYNAVMDELIKQEYASVDLNEMMVKMISNADKVIVLLSEKYKQRADSFEGGVGAEYRIILNGISANTKKYIFATFDDLNVVAPDKLLPNGLGNREIISISNIGANVDWENQLKSKLSGEPIYQVSDVSIEKHLPVQKVIDFRQVLGEEPNVEKDGHAFSEKDELLSDEKGIPTDRETVILEIRKLLGQNKGMLDLIGPDSQVSINNPLSKVSDRWEKVKANTIIPNNDKVMRLFERHYNLFSIDEQKIYQKFKAHAAMFKMNQEYRMDMEAVPPYPAEFDKIIFNEEEKFDD